MHAIKTIAKTLRKHYKNIGKNHAKTKNQAKHMQTNKKQAKNNPRTMQEQCKKK